MPSVSVIVPVRNESRSIEHTLRLLLTQDFPRSAFEVIVADGVSTDDTVLIVRRLQSEFSNLKLVFNSEMLASSGRNTGIRHATKDVVVIVDGHCHVPDRDYLKKLSEAFATSRADCLGRPQPLDVESPTRFQQAVSAARSSRLGHNPDSDIYSNEAKFVPPQSTAVAYSRKVFHTIGLFDQEFDACEDVEFNERVHAAGLTCYFTPEVKIVYEPRGTFGALFYQLGRYGKGRAKLACKHPKSLSVPALVPPLWAVWAVTAGPLSAVVPYLGWLWLASIGLYAAVLLGAGAVLGRGLPLAAGARIPMVFVAIHFGFAWGFGKEVAKQARWWVKCRLSSMRPAQPASAFVLERVKK
ncbi:glycosyltransferase family 2 protein [Gemmata sp. G18]|uniref:Glycosyltransferase family 2 protein n=1 Tax=Gemmata palustris TaxID=2822762 RepID=A0ABS5C0X8_9BACT|nr:glycosyltransferase family 2 protein [Gemmata palustris]MBP3959307.1 glycosyltransferase family 2 protein [Gemmata palustris]